MYIVIITKLILFICIFNNVQLFENETLAYDNTTIASRRIHQITTILDGLLKDYQAHIRPNFGGNINILFYLFIYFRDIHIEGPTKINFDILVSSFGPIQDIDMVCILKNKNSFSL